MEDQAKYEIEKKSQPINIDFSKGIVPQNYNELLQFAALYLASGLAPKSFQTLQQLAIGIGMCLELDRPVLTGIQDMAVINGRVSIFGDAALAIVRRSGLLDYILEKEEGKPYTDSWTFTCTIKRKGAPEPRVGIWTWEDAKRAGFDDPKTRDGGKDNFSPWRRFTRRMMQFKARNFPLRDEFGDVIKGMTLAEDAQDIIDVTPVPARSLKVETKEELPGDPYRVQPPPPPANGKEELPPPVEELPTGQTFPCPHCDWVSQTERGLKKHMTQSHGKDEGQPTGPPENVQPEPPQEAETDKLSAEEIKYMAEVAEAAAALNDSELASLNRYFSIKAGETPLKLNEAFRASYLKQLKQRVDKQNA